MNWHRDCVFGMVVIAGCCGCRDEPSEVKQQKNPPTRYDVTLSVLVVDDRELATGVNLLRGEWAQRSGGQLKVQQWTSDEFTAAVKQTPFELPADIIVYPVRYSGTLTASKSVRPVRQSILRGPQFASADLFSAIRDREIIFGDEVIALPLGSPPLLLCYNPALLTNENHMADFAVPNTWADYRRVQQQLSDKGSPCIMPLAQNTAAYTLLARAVNYASQGRGNAVLFDVATFQPRISEPPFVRALNELTEELAGSALELSLQTNFASAAEAVAKGQAAITLSWPGAFRPQIDENTSGDLSYAQLPRALEIYNTTRNRWDTNRLESSITLLGAAGRMASVTATSRNATSAFKLLEWLCCGKTGLQLSARSSHTLWHRDSQEYAAIEWMGQSQQNPREIAETVAAALKEDACYLVPRIPGIDQYLVYLSEAVRQAVKGADAAEALLQTAKQWSEITEQLGRQSQRAAYRQHLGL